MYSCLATDPSFRRWHARMVNHGPTKAIFDLAKILDLLKITLYSPTYDLVLFPIALSFWFSEYNTFVFPLGPMSITLRDVGALINFLPLDDFIFLGILIAGVAPKYDKKLTESYLGIQGLYTVSNAEPSHVERVAFLEETNAKAGVEIYAPQFFARQLGFGQMWPAPPCYFRNLTERFYTINKTKAQAIDARNNLLAKGFSLAHFNPTAVMHSIFDQLWPSVKRRLFTTDANHAFHLLDKPYTSSTFPIQAIPVSIRNPTSSPQLPLTRAKRPTLPPASPPIQATTAKVLAAPAPSPPTEVTSFKSSDEGTLLKDKSLVSKSSSQLVEKLPSSQGVDPPKVLMDLSIVIESTRPDKGKSPQMADKNTKCLHFSLQHADAMVRSIRDLYTSWGQVKTSSAFPEENMNNLKQSVFEYVSFMDIDIGKASATRQKDKFELLSVKLAQPLKLPSLNVSFEFKETLKREFMMGGDLRMLFRPLCLLRVLLSLFACHYSNAIKKVV
ncbi:unnamed protein product [Fraxinus pennsylvanica]|uniref:Uncharacterized protein n=1 Tax=Fraxinus pennsylvanica TaxID=56036 RepID=A0AAD2DJI1_9LAMI|nr:unnamed protein product [Fraxinus pennsylvanica]